MWRHEFVQAKFAGTLIRRRKAYPSELRDTLSKLFRARRQGDYETTPVTEIQAARALMRSRRFVSAVGAQLEGHKS